MSTARWGRGWLVALVLVSGWGVAATPVQDWAAVSPGGSGDARAGVGSDLPPISKRALAVDAAGNSYVTGRVYNNDSGNDYLTQKFDANGVLLWSARYNGPSNGSDQAFALVLDGAGDVIVTGESWATGSPTNFDYVTLKYSGATGATVWSGESIVNGAARYNGPGSGTDTAYALALDGAGNVVVTGVSMGSGTGNDYATLKYASATGATLWSGGAIVDGAARYDGPGNGNDSAYAVALDGAGDVVVTGFSAGPGTDYATLKYAGATGATLWSGGAIVNGAARYDGGNGSDIAYALAVDSAGDVVVTGYSAGGSSYDYATLKYASATGVPLWAGGAIVNGAARYNGPGNSSDYAHALAVDGAGNVVVTGYSVGSGTFDDYATLKYAGATGAPMWTGGSIVNGAARYNGPFGDDRAYSLALAGNGDVVVTGSSESGINGIDDFATLKYSSVNGATLWSGGAIANGAARYNGPGSNNFIPDRAYSVALDATGDVRVAGTQHGINEDFGLIRYAGASGSQTWVASEGVMMGLSDRLDSNRALKVDAVGSSYVTSSAFNGSNNDYLTQKFDANGVLLWSARYDGTGNGDDFPSALALDGSGNVVVTGASFGGGTGFDYATLKYAGDTGAPMWSGGSIVNGAARYSGPGNFSDGGNALALDGAGDVVVTGYSQGSGTGIDYATLKYAGATGAPLWSGGAIVDGAARYNGPNNGTDGPVALALDSIGDVVVTGYSAGIGTGDDYATLKYAGGSGVPLWSGGAIVDGAARYNGPLGNGPDWAQDLVLDGAGDVVVTGASAGIGTDRDYATLKYTGATGAPVWSGGAIVAGAARYNGPLGNGSDWAYALALDVAGDVVVTGHSAGNGTGDDYATLKYAGATGAPLWSGGAIVNGAVRYNGPGNNSDQAFALAIDASGNVVVTGNSTGSGTSLDYATVKYVGTNGAETWTNRYDGGVSGSDRAFAVALAPDASLRIAGTAVTPQAERAVVLKLRELSDNANLAALSLTGHTFTPAFAPGTTSYAASVGAGASVEVVATAQQAATSVAIAGQAAQTAVSSRSVALSFGANPIAVAVTAEDGVATETYTVTAYRAAIELDPASLAQTYTGAERAATATTQPAGLANDVIYQGIDGTVYGPSTTPPTNAGRYMVTAMLTAANYSGSTSDTLVVAKAAGSVAFDTLSFTYDGGTKAVIAHISEEPATTCAVPASPVGPNAGSYPVSATCTGSNYTASGNASAIIAKATGTIAFDALSFTYDGNTKTVTAYIDEEPATTCAVPASPVGPNAGSYPVGATCTGSNYTASGNASAIIAKATGTVAFDALSFTYDGSTKAVTAHIVEEPATTCVVPASPIGPTAGSYPVNATCAGSNYTASGSTSATITKATGTVAFDSLSFTYDGSTKAVTAHIAEEPVTICSVPASPVGPNAGSYPVMATCTGANYTASGNTSATIAKATGTVAFDALSFTYDGSIKAVTAHIIEEPATTCVVPASPIGPNAGSYPVSATCTGTNYTASGNATATISSINQGTLTVSANPSSMVFGATSALSTQGGTGNGAVSFAVTAGAAQCTVTGSTLTGIGVGVCTVTATKAADGNFNATAATVQVSVTPKADLQLAKDANRAAAQVGETVVYSIVVANAGPNDVVGATLSDTPPATLGSVEWACIASTSSGPCPVAPNDAGSGTLSVSFGLGADQHLRYDLTATVQAAAGAQIQNMANVSTPNGVFDPNLSNNAGTSTILVVPQGIFADGFETLASGKLSLPAAEKVRARW